MIRSFISLAGRKNGEYVSNKQRTLLSRNIHNGKFENNNWLVEANDIGVTAIYYKSVLVWSKDDGWREAYRLRAGYLARATFGDRNLLQPEKVLYTLESLKIKNSGYFKSQEQSNFILNQPALYDPVFDDEYRAMLKKRPSILARITFGNTRYYLNEAGIVNHIPVK